MQTQSRPEGMSDIAWLVALEEIRQLRARRDRYVDAHDWDGYQALHAPDHVSHHAPDPHTGKQGAWTSSAEMIANIRQVMDTPNSMTVHHAYDPEINFVTELKAHGIWAMTAGEVFRGDDGAPGWRISYGYYYETYEKRDGRWLFTTRRWQRYIGVGSDGVIFPAEPLKGSDAFAAFKP